MNRRTAFDAAAPTDPALSPGRLVIVSCPFCTYATAPCVSTMAHSLLRTHVATCPKHPMRAIEADNARFRAALERLVGGSDRADLERLQKSAAGRAVVACARARFEEAIAVLLATLPEGK